MMCHSLAQQYLMKFYFVKFSDLMSITLGLVPFLLPLNSEIFNNLN